MKTALKIDTSNLADLQVLASSRLMPFMAVCEPHYLIVESGEFHFELSNILENSVDELIEIIGFRGSSKTTMVCAFILQCALTGRFKFMVLINDTTDQVELNFYSIKTELEHNPMIKKMFPNVRLGQTWSKKTMLIEIRKPDGTFEVVRIVGRSRGQNIRGVKHKEHRPDLILVDDPENLQQVKTKENRDKTEAWFNGEVIPAAQENNSKVIVIGNFLHNDGFMARLSKNPLFKVIRIPFYNENGEVNWKGKYPTQESVDRQRKKVGETAWAREYLLKIVAEDDQVIKETDIQKYPNEILTKHDVNGELPIKITDCAEGMDLAIGEKQTNDFTAIVGGYRVIWNKQSKILVLPNPIKKRMNFDVTITTAVNLKNTLPYGAKFFVEDIGYQRVAIQTLKRRGVAAFPIRPITDKKARLQSVAPFVKDGTVMFPETGCEDLIQSIINFGIEEHDDDVDAFVYLILGLINKKTARAVAKIDRL